MLLLSIAASGMTRAAARFERSAEGLMQGDAAAIVDTIIAKAQFKASAALVHVSDDMMTDLLEIQRDR
jgi:hypothetical protein